MISDRRMKIMESVNNRLKQFLEDEARSGSMDFVCHGDRSMASEVFQR